MVRKAWRFLADFVNFPGCYRPITIIYMFSPWTFNNKDTTTKCRLVKNWPVKELCARRLLEFIDRRYFFSCSPPHPPFSLSLCKSTVQYIQTVCGLVGDGGMLSCVGDHILQEFNNLYLTTFST
jgi:hypothetical protein